MCCCFLAVDDQGPASKASLSCSTLEKLRGFSCHSGNESSAACESVKMDVSGTGQLESTMREQVKMEEDTEEELVQSKQVCLPVIKLYEMELAVFLRDTWSKIGKPSAGF